MCLKKFSSELEQFGLASSSRVAVGTLITERPPHRSRRALLTHRAYMRTRLSRGQLSWRTQLWVIRYRSLRDENRSMSAMPRKRRRAVKLSPVAMGHKQKLDEAP